MNKLSYHALLTLCQTYTISVIMTLKQSRQWSEGDTEERFPMGRSGEAPEIRHRRRDGFCKRHETLPRRCKNTMATTHTLIAGEHSTDCRSLASAVHPRDSDDLR